ncbi:hypothetical protein BV20DRAFT_447076 [Pilatotrama ljubarskyi]|nr:hypothetical protein BV20DRAFT_447076 [Pilatotrama ljubarskyi]
MEVPWRYGRQSAQHCVSVTLIATDSAAFEYILPSCALLAWCSLADVRRGRPIISFTLCRRHTVAASGAAAMWCRYRRQLRHRLLVHNFRFLLATPLKRATPGYSMISELPTAVC